MAIFGMQNRTRGLCITHTTIPLFLGVHRHVLNVHRIRGWVGEISTKVKNKFTVNLGPPKPQQRIIKEKKKKKQSTFNSGEDVIIYKI